MLLTTLPTETAADPKTPAAAPPDGTGEIRVPSFMPSAQGFQFVNHFAPAPIPLKTPLGTISLGNASGGMCGGMVFAARDYFEAEEPVPQIQVAPVRENDLFAYIAGRLWDSFGGVKALRYYQWMQMSDTPLAKQVWERELPQIRREIEGGRLACLGVVLAAGANLSNIGLNHQVLCYGLDVVGNAMTLHVYDPNTPHAEGDAAFIRIERSGDTYQLTHNLHTHSQTLRGFFFNTAYRWQAPPPAKENSRA